MSELAGCGVGSGGGVGGGVGGGGSESCTGTATTVIASQVIDSGGGTIAVTGSSPLAGTQAVLPAGALSGATTITLSQVIGAGAIPCDVLVVELGPAGTVYSEPVSVTIKYSQQYLANNGIGDPTTLKVVALVAGASGDTLRTVSQNAAQSTLTAQATRAGRFAVLGHTRASLSGRYVFNFTIVDPRFAPPVMIDIVVPDDRPFNGTATVPFPGFAFSTELGTIAFDGAGNYSWSGTRNAGGVPRPVGGSGTYTVAADGTLALDIGPVGSVLAGGSTFLLVATSEDVVEMGAGVKISGAYGNASLSGSYGVAHYYSDATAGPLDTITIDVQSTPFTETVDVPFPAYAFNSEMRTVQFNGAGGYTWSGTRNRGGVSSEVAGSGTYAVAVDGTLRLDTGLTGGVLADGSTFVLASTSGVPIEIAAGVKLGGTFSNASLGGTYTVALHYVDATTGPPDTIVINVPDTPHSSTVAMPFPARAFNSELRTVTFNGAGSYTWSGTRNRGGVSSPVAGNGTYAVAADGTLTLDGGLAGNVLAGGSTFVVASTSGQAIEIGVGILR